MSLAARIQGVGLVGPGLASWSAGRALLTGSAGYAAQPTVIPSPAALPPTERRRAGKCVRLSLAAGLEAAANAGRDAADLVAIFASSTGDGENLHAICETLASEDRLISPTRFHNSVHNAPAGYWGIATGATHAADSVAAFDASFAAGLIEALGRLAQDPAQAVLLIAYDAPYPEPLYSARPVPDSFAAAFLLAVDDAQAAGVPIGVAISTEPACVLDAAPFESLRRTIPAARALPLLLQLARGVPGRTVIEYLDGLTLAIEVGR
ncbi:MAG: beta-ketoacyl synthase chain length factor [Pseudomonadota bacterium]|nr:beta-ketoacyl synthase chain length factor [Pseudomonadota bacterium]